MRILLVHNEYACHSGEEEDVARILSMLQHHGHDVVTYFVSSASIGNSFISKARAFFSGIYSPRSRGEIAKLLDSAQVDVVQVQNLYPLLSPSILLPCRARHIPVVMRCPNYRLFCPIGLHLSRGSICERCLGGEWWCLMRNCAGSPVRSAAYALRNAVARYSGVLNNNVSCFVVLSEFQRRRFVAGGVDPKRLRVVPGIAPLSSVVRSQTDTRDCTISFAGRISPEKGIYDVLAAAAVLRKQQFAIAGNGPVIQDAKRRATENTKFVGFISGDALQRFWMSTGIFVFSSRWFEGFPNVVLEAMAAGKAVVASRVGCLPEIVEHGTTGLLYEPGNVDDLVKKLDKLLGDGLKRESMGLAGRRKAEKEYSSERCYERWMDVYRKVIGQ